VTEVLDRGPGPGGIESLRPAPERISHYRRVPADAAEWFDATEVERGRAYNRPLNRLRAVRAVLSTLVLVAFITGHGAQDVIDGLGVRGWALQVLVVAATVELLSLIFGPWFSAYKSLVHDRRWNLSTQTPANWLGDELKELLLGVVITGLLLVPLYAVIRATDLWWFFGWLIFSGFTLAFGFLWPVVIAPLFNKFTPLEDERLAARIHEVAERADLDISGVQVADASKRSRATNAYVAGLGRTRRVVLFDTILEWPPELIEQVVAHELGHWKHAHLRRKVPVLVAAQLVMFVATWAITRWEPVLDWAGVDSMRDPASLPLFLLVFPASLLLTGLGTAWLSRADERQADIHALEVLGEPEGLIAVFRRLADDNKADVDPSLVRRLQAAHPPLAERMAMAQLWEQRHSHPG
jgi:STE24 endopeptidase